MAVCGLREESGGMQRRATAASSAGWPPELEELATIPAVKACLHEMGITSIGDFAENFDPEDGHDKILLDAVATLPDKPKRKKVQKVRARKVLDDLLLRFRIFEQLDEDGDCNIDRNELAHPAAAAVVSKEDGGTLIARFDSLAPDGTMDFPTFITHFVPAESVSVLPGAQPGATSMGTRQAIPENIPPHATPSFQDPDAAIRLWVKTSSSVISVIADKGGATTVAEIRAKLAAESSMDLSSCKLIFAGRELDDRLTLASYNCEAESELNLVARAFAAERAACEDTSVDTEAEEATAALREMMRGKQLKDFAGFKKIGGKDIQAAAGSGYSQNGVCSYVYLAHIRNGDGLQLALKVMLNYQEAHANTLAIREEFDAETALLSDPVRLPPHRHIMAVLHTFTDTVDRLPGWDFDPTIVMSRTMVVVMPFFEQDLKAVLRSVRKRREAFTDIRAVRIIYHLLLAVLHLKNHGIAHRDVKLDNVLLTNIGTDNEAAILTDFGMCFDMKKNRVDDWKIEMKFDGFRRGGAPIALAPEVTLPRPGPDVHLDYSKNDEWAVGMIGHELLSPPGGTPFADMDHPATYVRHSHLAWCLCTASSLKFCASATCRKTLDTWTGAFPKFASHSFAHCCT